MDFFLHVSVSFLDGPYDAFWLLGQHIKEQSKSMLHTLIVADAVLGSINTQLTSALVTTTHIRCDPSHSTDAKEARIV